MKKRELLELTPEQWEDKIKESKKKLMSIRFQRVFGHVDNVMEKRMLKKDIVRCKTFLSAHKR